MTRKTAILIGISAIVAFGCIDNTSYVTQERSDKIAKYILKKAPKIQHPAAIDLEGKIEYLGYDLKASDPRPGSLIQVTWYWKVKQELGPGWRLFTHGIGKNDEKFNRDTPGPVRESFQPEHWRKGMIIQDYQSFRIPKNWSSDTLDLRVGIWKGPARLKGKKGMDSGNRIRGPEMKVSVKPKKPPLKIPYTTIAPKIDGEFDNEAAWKNAVSLGAFVNTMKGTSVKQRTDVKVMWDDTNLYVAFHAQDENLISQYEKHDDELWHEDAFEMFLDPKGDKRDYYELQVSPKGVVFDSYLPSYRKNHNDWSSNMTVRVKTEGTVNDTSDKDTSWSGEIAVPFSALSEGGGVPPKAGDIWAVNFFRIDKGNEKTEYSGWSPPMRGDFHTLAKFGAIVFEKKVAPSTEAAAVPKPSPASAAKERPGEKHKVQSKKDGKGTKKTPKEAPVI